MSLVAYPDSDGDAEDSLKDSPGSPAASLAQGSPTGEASGLKRKRVGEHATALPPLPDTFFDLYTTNARASTSDDPSLHGGRKRAVPHIEGNWPSHVYLEWVPSAESENLHRLIESVQEAINAANKARAKPLIVPDITPSLRSPLGAPLPLHISLSRTLQIKTHDREKFLETLTNILRRASVRPFEIRFTTLKWVPNFERNRWFLVLGIQKPAEDDLNRLLSACNESAERTGHPGLYIGGEGDGPMEHNTASVRVKRRRRSSATLDVVKNQEVAGQDDRTDNFHISIAWNLIEPAPEWIELAKHIAVNTILQSPRISFNAVKAKIGNVVHNIPLDSRHLAGRRGSGILGLA